MQQEVNASLLKGINLFGDLHHTGTPLEIQAMPDLNIVKSSSGELSWIFKTYFKNKLPSSEIKPRLNIADAPKATCTSFSSCFLGKQRGNRHQTRQLCNILVTDRERRRKDSGSPQREGSVGKAVGNAAVPGCSVLSRSREAAMPGVPGFPSKIHVL